LRVSSPTQRAFVSRAQVSAAAWPRVFGRRATPGALVAAKEPNDMVIAGRVVAISLSFSQAGLAAAVEGRCVCRLGEELLP